MKTPMPPKCLSIEINDVVTCSMIRLNPNSFGLRSRSEQFFPWGSGNLSVCHAARSVPLDMCRMNPECHDSDTPDRLVATDVLLRQEPDEEEDEEEDEGNGKDDDGDHEKDDGYSE
jgi:hypothetical protein